MDIIDFKITENGEIITFRRHYIEESGIENCRYALWEDKKELKFGLLNEQCTYGIGISIKDNYELVVNHLKKIISSGKVSVIYRYIPAPPEEYGSGVVCEILPKNIPAEREVPQDVIVQFKQVLAILEHYKEVM